MFGEKNPETRVVYDVSIYIEFKTRQNGYEKS